MERTAPKAHEELVEAITKYNATLNNEDSTRKQLADALDALETAAGLAKAAYKVDAYAEALEADDPVKFAITRFSYKTVKVKVDVEKETKEELGRYIEETEDVYDLLYLQSFYQRTQTDRTKTLFSDPKAPHILQRVNEMLTLRIAQRIQGKSLVHVVEQKYAIGTKAAELMLDRKIPAKESDVATLVQELADAFWTGLTISKERINTVIETYATASQGLSVKCPPHSRLLALVFKAMHAEAVQKNFELLYPQKKQK